MSELSGFADVTDIYIAPVIMLSANIVITSAAATLSKSDTIPNPFVVAVKVTSRGVCIRAWARRANVDDCFDFDTGQNACMFWDFGEQGVRSFLDSL